MASGHALVMPKLGLTMTEGTVANWRVRPGEPFDAGTVLVVVESEKVAFDVEAPSAGILEEILVGEAEIVPVGTPIARWRGAAEAPSAQPFPQASPAPCASGPAPDPKAEPPSKGIARESKGQRQIATPLARRLARERGLDIGGVPGTGPRGRVQARDIEAADVAASASSTASPLTVPSGIQRTMAERVTQAKREIPHFYLSTDIDVGALLDVRVKLNAAPGRPKISMTHLLVAAIVQALSATPDMNRVWTEAGIQAFDKIEVGLAIDTERGLMNPVLRGLGGDSLYGIARRVDDAIDRARRGALAAGDFGGGTITLSNAGMHRLHYMASIIVPGQSAILGIGAVQHVFRPDAQGAPVLKRELGITLSADHRIHTGVGALAFLAAFEKALADPLLLLAGY